MTNETDNRAAELIELAADIVSAYVSNNPLPVAELPALIASVHSSLSTLDGPVTQPVEQKAPVVNPKKSVTPDFIISLEDGRKLKSMKRYLGLLGMTPDDYRAKWGLPSDYPMVAPNYAAARSALAKASGLGRKAAPVEMTSVKKAPAKRKAKA
jgi:predicted transcriptional regulator